MLKWRWIASLMRKACCGRSVGKAATGGSYFNKYLMGHGGCISVCVFSGGLVIYMCVYKGFHMKSHFKRSFKWGRRSLSHSISILEEPNFLLLCIILSISSFLSLLAAVFSSNLAIYPPWKLNEGTCCVGSAPSGPTELIREKLFDLSLYQSTWGGKSEQKKVYPAIIAHWLLSTSLFYKTQ